MKKIGLIAAMAEESKNVLVWLGKCEKTDIYGDFSVKKYIKNGCEIYFVNSNVGEILAAASTQLLVAVYKIDLVINFGLAGSLGQLGLSQMCLVEKIVHYDFDISALDGIEVGRYSRFASPLIETDKVLFDLAKTANPSMKSVICASADKFVSDEKIKENLKTNYGAEICEMESAGILLTSLANKIPSLFIKVISDTKDHAEEFSAFVERNNFEFISVLDKILISLN